VESTPADRAWAKAGLPACARCVARSRRDVEVALNGIAGDDLPLLTWLDRADRSILRVHPRGDPAFPEQEAC
jgi:hypothetical protein